MFLSFRAATALSTELNHNILQETSIVTGKATAISMINYAFAVLYFKGRIIVSFISVFIISYYS